MFPYKSLLETVAGCLVMGLQNRSFFLLFVTRRPLIHTLNLDFLKIVRTANFMSVILRQCKNGFKVDLIRIMKYDTS